MPLCEFPYVSGFRVFGCGKCLPCTKVKRRVWTHRIMLESYAHKENSFLTLTYDDDHLPKGGSLVPRDYQLFFKRFRKIIYPRSLRYFLVGEYGEKSFRPHYHAALFGISCSDVDIVQRAWTDPKTGSSIGHVLLGDLNISSARYIAGYVTKKVDAPSLPVGLYPQFTRMSNQPGIGFSAVEEIALALDKSSRFIDHEDVPQSLRIDGQFWPLGRYIRSKVREALSCDPSTPSYILDQFSSELQSLYEAYESTASDAWKALPFNVKIRSVISSENSQKISNLKSRFRIFDQKRTLQ